jgi:hypothetical protein
MHQAQSISIACSEHRAARTTCQIERAATQSIRKCATLDLSAPPVTCRLSDDGYSQLLGSR